MLKNYYQDWTIKMKLAKILQRQRIEDSLNQTELATEIGIDPRRLSKLEKGKQPTAEEMEKSNNLGAVVSDYTWSPHAEERANERFDGVDKNILLDQTRSATKAEKKLIRKTCPASVTQYMSGWFQSRHYLVARNRYVFVIQKTTIITCWDMAEPIEFNIAALEHLENSIGNKQKVSILAGELFGLIKLAKQGLH